MSASDLVQLAGSDYCKNGDRLLLHVKIALADEVSNLPEINLTAAPTKTKNERAQMQDCIFAGYSLDKFYGANKKNLLMKHIDNLTNIFGFTSAGFQSDQIVIPCNPLSSVRCFRHVGTALVLFGLIAAISPSSASIPFLSDLSFISNGGVYINNTIVDTTSPLGITDPTLGQPFLNNADSTISLAFDNYYAYSFAGTGKHVGAGTISGLYDGTPFSAAVTFPSDLTTVATFFSYTFVGGETLKVGTTGLFDDRIQIVSD